MQFKDIPQQIHLCNHLSASVDDGRIPHAMLLCGAASDGSLAVALAYAQYVCCEHRQHYDVNSDDQLRADSCGSCPTCRKIDELIHSDLHLLFPTVTGTEAVKKVHSSVDLMAFFRQFVKDHHAMGTLSEWYDSLDLSGNQQGLIREQDADDVVKALSMKSYEGAYKMVVVWMAEKMNSVCANKLLKTLEEPTGRTLLLLVSENTDSMLSTVLSRTQIVQVPGDNGNEKWPSEFAPLFVGWMRMLFKLNMQSLSRQVDELAAMGREVQKQFLQYCTEMVRLSLMRNMAQSPESMNTGDARFDTSFPTMVTVRNAAQLCEAFNDTQYAIERNVNAKIAFMQLSFTLSKLIKNR